MIPILHEADIHHIADGAVLLKDLFYNLIIWMLLIYLSVFEY